MTKELTMQENNEVIIPPITDDTLIGLADQAEKRVDALNKIKRAALKATNPHDWVDQNGRPYLQSSGSQKVGRVFGISWRIDEPVFEKEESGHFAYTYKGYFSLAGAEIEAIGTRSSKDGFFKRYDKERKELPTSEIDKGDVKKAAWTNCIGNGVTSILGLKNLTWEDLQAFAGITKDQVGRVDYKKNGKTQDGIKSENAQTVTVGVADIRKQTGTNAKTKKPWTKFIIKDGEGKEYGTFSETTANTAKEAREAGLQIEISYTAGQFGNDIEAIKKCEPPAREEAKP